ncbi:MAG TPA: phosphoglycerate kinase [Symbiobacteriaceae bacterium]|nr:phosphoglycerate kinase [Symbiobacteriaceae bacterium]
MHLPDLEPPDAVPLCAVRNRLHEVQGHRILVRVDLNVPTGSNHEVLCDYRFRRIVGLIDILVKLHCVVILISHCGRPHGRPDPECSLEPFVAPLQRLLARKIHFLPDCVGPEVEHAIHKAPSGSVFLLENLRFHPGEVAADPEFAKQLARLADCYINDSFSVSHRAHASTVVLPHLLPAYASPSFVHEYQMALNLVRAIQPPMVVISGGRKLDKLLIYKQLMHRIDSLLLGSGFSDTYAEHPEVLGDPATVAHRIITPPDLVVARPGALHVVEWDALTKGTTPVDIGPRAVELYCSKIESAGTLLFNGAPGILDPDHPLSSHKALLHAFISAHSLKVVFGGTGCSLFMRSGLARQVHYIFPGGGALLSFLNNQSNPAIPLLSRNGWSALSRTASSHQSGKEGPS